ncbi:HEAT repeat domain-containing protein [Streptomyces zhihengii]|uniref:HEAT repeat domain-containing protein n=1 Tax=Streptomyces zhihengii TaxID=1818004 RepID=A0ABS2V5M7_9ACTN|nr:HEAT repeat domain-containing protein [Streptomyces zhihengii]MBM9624729.1 HEAT repeat domain-containing protein [Streptomyces zhihengii]
MTDHRDAVLRLWGRQLFERQGEPLAWAEGVLGATGRPLTVVTSAMSGRLDALADSPSDRAWLLFRTVAKLVANLRADGRYDAYVGTRIGPLALRLGELEPSLAGPLGDALGHLPDGPASLVTVHAAELSRSHTQRLRAIDALLEWAELGHPQARAALSDVASDHRMQEVTVWTKALNRIALFGDASVEQGLLRALADTGHRGVRWTALACAELGFRRAVPLIIALLEHPDPMVREGACEALGIFEDPAAIPALAARLDDEIPWVRSRAALALGHIGGDRALAVLWQAMMERRNPKANHLASAIAAFGPPVVDDLITLTTDPDPDLRALACRALGSTADGRALPVLERLAAHDLVRTTLGCLVATAAKQGLRTARRIRARTAST